MVKHEKYGQMYEEYRNGSSLSQVAAKFVMTRQSVFMGFKRRGYAMRTKNEMPFVMYDGLKFSLRDTGYYGRTTGKRVLLHRYKYQKEVENVSDKWDVHHIDGNKLNNDIGNLVALPKDVHASLFNTGRNQYGENARRNQDLGERERRINFYIARKQEFVSGKEVVRNA